MLFILVGLIHCYTDINLGSSGFCVPLILISGYQFERKGNLNLYGLSLG